MMASNPNTYSQTNRTDATLTQIEDDVDFPHSGIFKALGDGLGQNYAISGFDVTSDSASQIDVTAGVIFRDGKRHEVALSNNMALSTTYTNGYHLLVATSATPPVLALRAPTSSETNTKVPPITTGDTIIALVTHTGSNPCNVQYFTVNKTEHSSSIGYDDSGYTEAMSIEGSATKTTFHNKIADADVRFVLGDNTADEKFEIVTDDDADGDLTDTLTEVFSVDGTGLTKVKSLSLGSAAELTITESSDDITIKNTVANKDIIFNVNDSDGGGDTESMRIDGDINQVKVKSLGIGSAAELTITESSDDITIKNTVSDKDIIFNANDGGVDTEIMRIDGSESRVGIGTNAPATKLDVKGDGTFSRSGDLGITTTVTIEGARNAAGSNFAAIDFKNYDSHGPTSYVGARISATNESTAVDDGSLVFSTNNANAGITERMRIRDSGEVGIGLTGPDYALDVNGSIRRKGNVQAITTVAGDALGPPPVMTYNILSTDDVILASAPSGTPPNNLTLHLPDVSVIDIGRTYRIVATDATNTLNLDRTGSTDAVHGPDDVQLTLPYSLSGGKIYDVICVADNKWMLLTLN